MSGGPFAEQGGLGAFIESLTAQAQALQASQVAEDERKSEEEKERERQRTERPLGGASNILTGSRGGGDTGPTRVLLG